ncbi:MAG: small subunit ribosomal protein S1 [Alteromonas naphthalenivorans]|jgi:small subunit ribosomal protein S1
MSKEIIRPDQFGRVELSELENSMDLELSTEQLEELSELYEGFFSVCKPGKVVEGKIVNVSNDGVLVDIGFKSEGLIPRYEFSPHEIKKFKSGDMLEVIFDELESIDGTLVLSYEKAKALKAWDIIMKLHEEDKPVEGVVTHKVKGGLSVDIGIPAFLPGSQVDVQRVNNFDQYVGQTIIANIIKVNKKRGNVIISRRKHLSEQRAEVRKKVLDTLDAGQTIEGLVKNITNYGVFIDIGGVDGLLHITDMTWGRISHPSEIVKIGDSINVKVLSFDKDNEKISLGMKQLTENPWEQMTASIEGGSQIKGKVSSITDYGLFVEVQKGVEGLIHISEISWTDRITDLKKYYKPGDEVQALVISVDKDNRRMSLSIKQLDKNPWETVAEEFKVGEKVNGTVSNITDFGVFVLLKPGIDGLIHVSDLSWTEHIEHPADVYKRNDKIEAVILGVDVNAKKISLGIKQLAQNPWENIEKHYQVNNVVEGEISRLTNFGMFVKLESGIEGLVHISELAELKKEDKKIEDVYKVGEKRQFRVIKVSKDEHKLGLSTKLDEVTKEEKQAPKPQKAQPSSVEPVAKAKSQFQVALEEAAARNKKDEGKE